MRTIAYRVRALMAQVKLVCPVCGGSGKGNAPGGTCWECHGWGYIVR
jgi:DnaJ-class molecular chaperone